jgi:hypothetical protein
VVAFAGTATAIPGAAKSVLVPEPSAVVAQAASPKMLTVPSPESPITLGAVLFAGEAGSVDSITGRAARLS